MVDLTLRWRRRCRYCGRRVYPWQCGVWRDGHGRRSRDWLEHASCYDAQTSRPTSKFIRKDSTCRVCDGPVNYYDQCLAEIWSGRNRH
jgi:hypothetical protein